MILPGENGSGHCGGRNYAEGYPGGLIETVNGGVRQDRALAQVAEKRVHPTRNAAFAGRCTASRRGLRGALQQRPPEQCHRLHHAQGRASGASAGDPRGTRPQVRSRQGATPESPPANRVKSEAASQRDRTAKENILNHSRWVTLRMLQESSAGPVGERAIISACFPGIE